jgi:hypothetical protein
MPLKPSAGIIDLDSMSEGLPTTDTSAPSGWSMDTALADAATRRPDQGGGGTSTPMKDTSDSMEDLRQGNCLLKLPPKNSRLHEKSGRPQAEAAINHEWSL